MPTFNEKGTRALQIKVPVNYHRHSNKFLEQGYKLRKNIQLKEVGGEIYLNLIWEKEELKKKDGRSLGVDLGVNKLIASSEGQLIGSELNKVYRKLKRRVRGSKGYRRTLAERDNPTNCSVNKLDLSGVGFLCVEDLKGVKYKKSHKEQIKKGKNSNKKKTRNTNEKVSHWIYPQVIKKLERTCEQEGILMEKVSPAYTSQTCSHCGNIDSDSRKGEKYKCMKCGWKIDADINAAINIRNRGEYSLSVRKEDKI